MGNIISWVQSLFTTVQSMVGHLTVQATQAEKQQAALDQAKRAAKDLILAASAIPTPEIAGSDFVNIDFTPDSVMYWLNSSYVNTAVTTLHGLFVTACGLGYWYGIDAIIDSSKDLGI